MNKLAILIGLIDRVTETVGRLAAWLAVAMVLVTCWIVLNRYVFDTGSVAVQESLTYLNALLFMLAAAYTLRHNGHVRVDIFYSPASARYRAWVNLLGSVFLLLPVSLFIIIISWDYVAASWRIREQSGDAGGLPWIYLLKSLIPLMGALLILQGLAEFLRNLLALRQGGEPGPANEPELEEGSL